MRKFALILFTSSAFAGIFPYAFWKNPVVISQTEIPAPDAHYAFENTAQDSSGQNRHLTTNAVQGSTESVALDNGGVGYSDGTGVGTSGGSGSGLTVDITTDATIIISATLNAPGSGYAQGDILGVDGGIGGTVIVDIIEGGYGIGIITNGAFNTNSMDNGFKLTSYNLPSVNGTNSVTFGLWFRFTEGDNPLTAMQIFNGTQCFAWLQRDPGGDDFEFTIGEDVGFSDLIVRSIDTWYCCMFGYNSTNNRSWYSIDGAAKTVNTNNVNLSITGTYTLSVNQNTDDTQRNIGNVDGLTIWTNKMLSDAEISSFYNGGAGKSYYGGAWH